MVFFPRPLFVSRFYGVVLPLRLGMSAGSAGDNFFEVPRPFGDGRGDEGRGRAASVQDRGPLGARATGRDPLASWSPPRGDGATGGTAASRMLQRLQAAAAARDAPAAAPPAHAQEARARASVQRSSPLSFASHGGREAAALSETRGELGGAPRAGTRGYGGVSYCHRDCAAASLGGEGRASFGDAFGDRLPVGGDSLSVGAALAVRTGENRGGGGLAGGYLSQE